MILRTQSDKNSTIFTNERGHIDELSDETKQWNKRWFKKLINKEQWKYVTVSRNDISKWVKGTHFSEPYGVNGYSQRAFKKSFKVSDNI